MNKALIINDAHIPYHDEAIFENIVYPLIGRERFTDIIILGDWQDCYALSNFDKNPARLDGFNDELDTGIGLLNKVGRLSKNARKVFVPGNHEDRLRKILWKTKGLSGLKKLKWPSLLDFGENGFIYAEGLYRLNKSFVLTHGTLVRKHAGYTAKGMLDKYGVSGMSAHTHRMGSHSVSDLAGIRSWWENGHLSDQKKTEYVQTNLGGIANWQPGLAIIYYTTHRYHVESVHITNGRCVAAGKIYG